RRWGRHLAAVSADGDADTPRGRSGDPGPAPWPCGVAGPGPGPGRRGAVCSGGADAGAGLTPLERPAFVLREPPPDPRLLPRAQCPVQARLGDGTAAAHTLGLLDLHEGGAGRPDGEEQLRVLVAAERAVAPVHGGVLLDVVYGVVQSSPAS